jgi:adenylate cyclase class 2
MPPASQEIEIKLAVADAASARQLLRRVGFRISRPRVFEANTVFDTADLTLRNHGRLLRLRLAGRDATLTYKGTPLPGPHKRREEIECRVQEAEVMAVLLSRIGFTPMFRYEKYRTEFREPGTSGCEVVVDETPIGVYLELEGPPRWIDQTARRLGFRKSDYITASYGSLYFAWCEQRGEPPGHMVFRG